ncbi:MAG TPA: nitroreductase family protein [Pseudonocardia sp.]|jgi:nitroreductase|nr:nitroreductase family protein [Pseudonocardia sp.]
MTSTTADLSPDELLTTTRSVRRRLDLDRPVPLALVREALEVALQAPTGGNAQGWHWVVVTDAEKRAAIGEYYRQSYARYRASARYPGRAGDLGGARAAQQQRVAGSADHLAEVMGRVPVHVIACLTVGETLPAGNQAGLWGSLLPAAWSYQLAARARGLGTAWTTLHLGYEAEIAELLGIPADVRQGVLLPTAHYTGETFRPARRAPLDEVLHVDGW